MYLLEIRYRYSEDIVIKRLDLGESHTNLDRVMRDDSCHVTGYLM